MNKLKPLFLIMCLTLLFSLTAFNVFCEETTVSPETTSVTETQEVPWWESIAKEAIESGRKALSIEYSYDSVSKTGIAYDIYIDVFTKEPHFVIIDDSESGYEIYDNPETDHIDGILVNGERINSLDIKITPELLEKEIIILVKMVYSDNMFGTLAKIQDGNFDFETLTENPVIMLQGMYYVIAALSVISGGIMALTSKKKKVKTANDIAELVDRRTKEAEQILVDKALSIIQESFAPIFENTLNSNKATMKAIMLSNSRTKEAPLAIIDLLSEVSNTKTEDFVEQARASIIKNLSDIDKKKADTVNALKSITQTTQEDKGNEKTNNNPKVERSVF